MPVNVSFCLPIYGIYQVKRLYLFEDRKCLEDYPARVEREDYGGRLVLLLHFIVQ
jgi:hypothetical protein